MRGSSVFCCSSCIGFNPTSHHLKMNHSLSVSYDYEWMRKAGTSHLWWHREIETSIKTEREDCQNDGWWVCSVCQIGGEKQWREFRDQRKWT